jgi:hypothetical protein
MIERDGDSVGSKTPAALSPLSPNNHHHNNNQHQNHHGAGGLQLFSDSDSAIEHAHAAPTYGDYVDSRHTSSIPPHYLPANTLPTHQPKHPVPVPVPVHHPHPHHPHHNTTKRGWSATSEPGSYQPNASSVSSSASITLGSPPPHPVPSSTMHSPYGSGGAGIMQMTTTTTTTVDANAAVASALTIHPIETNNSLSMSSYVSGASAEHGPVAYPATKSLLASSPSLAGKSLTEDTDRDACSHADVKQWTTMQFALPNDPILNSVHHHAAHRMLPPSLSPVVHPSHQSYLLIQGSASQQQHQQHQPHQQQPHGSSPTHAGTSHQSPSPSSRAERGGTHHHQHHHHHHHHHHPTSSQKEPPSPKKFPIVAKQPSTVSLVTTTAASTATATATATTTTTSTTPFLSAFPTGMNTAAAAAAAANANAVAPPYPYLHQLSSDLAASMAQDAGTMASSSQVSREGQKVPWLPRGTLTPLDHDRSDSIRGWKDKLEYLKMHPFDATKPKMSIVMQRDVRRAFEDYAQRLATRKPPQYL